MEIKKAKYALLGALGIAQAVYSRLGERGKEVVKTNQFGDSALLIDWEIEERIISHLGEISESLGSIRVISEEHDIVNIGTDPKDLAVLDGMDGTNRYLVDEPCGTMFGIYEGTNPYYRDYLAGGIVIQKTGKVFSAERGGGSLFWGSNILDFGPLVFPSFVTNRKIRVCTDLHWDGDLAEKLRKTGNFEISDPRSMAVYCAKLLKGDADAILIGTRKQNLETAAVCGLLTEAGGVIRTLDGKNLLDKKFLEFGQGEEEIPIVVAASKKIAAKVLEVLNA